MARTTPRESQLGYLAGIIDGEGTIGCYFYHDRGNQSPRYGIWIVNSDKRILDRCKATIHEIGLENVFLGQRNYKQTNFKKTPSKMWYIQISRKADVKTLLEAITPHLTSKQEQAQLILNFFNDYPNLLYGRGTRFGRANENYAAYDKLITDIKEAKKKIGEPVETKR
jgi:hypothetical protein